MNEPTDRELMRLLHGELPAERRREIERRIAADPRLARRYRRLEAAWGALELPPPAPVPPGFAGRIAARAVAGVAPEAAGGWPAPAWVRAAGALALAAGLVLGALAGGTLGGTPETPETTAGAESAAELIAESWAGGSLAEIYWQNLVPENGTAGEVSP